MMTGKTKYGQGNTRQRETDCDSSRAGSTCHYFSISRHMIPACQTGLGYLSMYIHLNCVCSVGTDLCETTILDLSLGLYFPINHVMTLLMMLFHCVVRLVSAQL